jgi:hypothetical protein
MGGCTTVYELHGIQLAIWPKPAEVEQGWNRPGNDYTSARADSAATCLKRCRDDAKCAAYTFVTTTSQCWLKTPVPELNKSECCVSGVVMNHTSSVVLESPNAGARLPGPPGSYQGSCTNPHVTGGILFASCKGKGGEVVQTSLRGIANCHGDIGNNDGLLRCNNGMTPPRGSYSQSCTNVFNNTGELSAQCRSKSGELIRTALANFSLCQGDISNNDGRLQCARAAGPIPVGPAPQRTCNTNQGEVLNATTGECVCRSGLVRDRQTGGCTDAVR